jgi:CRP-like cAMP-binding protein
VQSNTRAFEHSPLIADSGEPSLRSGRTGPEGKSVKNRLLLSLPDGEFQSLRPYLTYRVFLDHASLHESAEELEFAHFPDRGLISVMVATKKSKTVEVAIVGYEGIVGTAAIIGLKRSLERAVVQVAGDGHRIRSDALQSLFVSCPHLQNICSRYAVIQGMQCAQFAACNRLHGVEQRLARWLMIAHDRLDQGPLHITHDVLATILGTDRPSVSLAASVLQRKNAIEYTRGVVRIVNRKFLEDATCECYGVIEELNRLLRN